MREFILRVGFSGQREIIRLEFRFLDDPHIGGDAVAFFYIDDISRHQGLGEIFHHLAVPFHFDVGMEHLLERFHDPLRFRFLHVPDDGVDEDDDRQYGRSSEVLEIQGDDVAGYQEDDENIFELPEKLEQRRDLPHSGEDILPVDLLSRRDILFSETVKRCL